jgi:hypothetical protein
MFSFQESDPENKISVKECMQKFQRMASESALQKAHLPASKKRFDKVRSLLYTFL